MGAVSKGAWTLGGLDLRRRSDLRSAGKAVVDGSKENWGDNHCKCWVAGSRGEANYGQP